MLLLRNRKPTQGCSPRRKQLTGVASHRKQEEAAAGENKEGRKEGGKGNYVSCVETAAAAAERRKEGKRNVLSVGRSEASSFDRARRFHSLATRRQGKGPERSEGGEANY